jgi:Secretion system C-terminal sorting domain
MKKIILFAFVFLYSINIQAQNKFAIRIVGNQMFLAVSPSCGFGTLFVEYSYTGTTPTDINTIPNPALSAHVMRFASSGPDQIISFDFAVSSPASVPGSPTELLIATFPVGTVITPNTLSINTAFMNSVFVQYFYDNAVLPVELLSFKGIKKGKISQLQWETANEKNLVNYIIERSSDGRNFHPVGFTKPKSTYANEKVAYDFIDDQPEMGINYYRLLSKGIGKDEKYSKVISLDFGLGLSGRVYPNPLDGELSIDLDIESNTGEVEVGIFDVVGKQVLSKKFQNNDRRVNMTLPTSDLAPGSYFIKVKVGSYNWERQITKM